MSEHSEKEKSFQTSIYLLKNGRRRGNAISDIRRVSISTWGAGFAIQIEMEPKLHNYKAVEINELKLRVP